MAPPPLVSPTGTCSGQLLFMDVRMVGDPSSTLNSGTAATAGADVSSDPAVGGSGSLAAQLSCCVVRQVEAHSKGGMSVMVAHPTAPLLATGSTAQVVKVWTDNGDVVSGGQSRGGGCLIAS
jgi:regulator-associated protein of mTOR